MGRYGGRRMIDWNILGDKGRVTQLHLKIGKWRFCLSYKLNFSAHIHNPRNEANVYDTMANHRFRRI